MKFSDNFKQYEDNLRLLLARLLVELQEDPEKLKEYTAKIKRRSSEKIYEGVDKIFSQLFFLESRIIFVRYGRIPCCWSKINNIRDRVVFPTLPNIAIG